MEGGEVWREAEEVLSVEVISAGGATRMTMKNSWRQVGAKDAATLGRAGRLT